MATAIENLTTRRNAVAAELAALTSTSAGGGMNYTVDGQSVDHVGYRKSLYEELDRIDEQIAKINATDIGPFSIESIGF